MRNPLVAGLRLAVMLAAGWMSVGAVAAEDAPRLGLAERRAIKQYQDGAYPAHLKAIQEAAGFEVPVEVQWEAIAVVGQAASYNEDAYWTQIFFQPLAAALKKITADDMGKEALKAGLKKIVITFDVNTAPSSDYPSGVSFDAGTLTINFTPYTNAGDESSADFKGRVDALVGALEPKL